MPSSVFDSDALFRLLVAQIEDYAIFALDTEGRRMSDAAITPRLTSANRDRIATAMVADDTVAERVRLERSCLAPRAANSRQPAAEQSAAAGSQAVGRSRGKAGS